jgi:hypothetical protein
MSNHDVHTVPNPAGDGWVNETGGAIVGVVHATKGIAVHRGRELAIQQRVEHVIHNADGTIGEKNSYGNDNFPPRG